MVVGALIGGGIDEQQIRYTRKAARYHHLALHTPGTKLLDRVGNAIST